MYVSFAEVRAGSVRLPAAEAVALVLAAAREAADGGMDGQPVGVPDADRILLSGSGRVWFEAAGAGAGERARVTALAALLRDLLAVDRRAHGKSSDRVPGALLVLIARAAGQIDLPPPSFAAFQETLARFGSADTVTLASIYRRVARGAGVREASTAAPGAPAVVTLHPPAPTMPVSVERRLHGPRVPDLRRDLRETELQLFAALQQNRRQPFGRRVSRRGVAAAALVIAAMGLSFALGFNETTKRLRSREVVRSASTLQSDPAAAASLNASDPVNETPRVDPPAIAEGLLSESQRPAAMPRPETRTGPPEFSVSPVLSARALGTDLFSPSFAGAGGELLFHAGRDRAALMRVSFEESGNPETATLLQDGAANYHATLSTDGEWLAFDSDRDGTRAVYVARPDARDARKISGDGYAAIPRWSPDGRQLAFVKAEPGRPRVWNVWVADVNQGTLMRVSRHRVGQAWGGSWFPDGRLAYSVEDTLVIASLDGDPLRVVRSPRRGRLIRTPAVSPDGQWIVFQVHRDGAWLLHVPTGTMRRVLDDRSAEEFAWSPDSRRVVYHTRRHGAYSLWQLELRDPHAILKAAS